MPYLQDILDRDAIQSVNNSLKLKIYELKLISKTPPTERLIVIICLPHPGGKIHLYALLYLSEHLRHLSIHKPSFCPLIPHI